MNRTMKLLLVRYTGTMLVAGAMAFAHSHGARAQDGHAEVVGTLVGGVLGGYFGARIGDGAGRVAAGTIGAALGTYGGRWAARRLTQGPQGQPVRYDAYGNPVSHRRQPVRYQQAVWHQPVAATPVSVPAGGCGGWQWQVMQTDRGWERVLVPAC